MKIAGLISSEEEAYMVEDVAKNFVVMSKIKELVREVYDAQ